MLISEISVELNILIYSVILLMLTIFAQQFHTSTVEGRNFSSSNRLTEFTSKKSKLFERTVRNTVENLAMFAPIALVLGFADISTFGSQNGAWLFLITRIVYAIVYTLDIIYVRSIAWFLGIVGIIMMIWPLFF